MSCILADERLLQGVGHEWKLLLNPVGASCSNTETRVSAVHARLDTILERLPPLSNLTWEARMQAYAASAAQDPAPSGDSNFASRFEAAVARPASSSLASPKGPSAPGKETITQYMERGTVLQ